MDLQKEINILEENEIKNVYKEHKEKNIELEILGKTKSLDLFGEFLYKNKKKNERYFLKIYVKNSKTKNKELTAIMLNPSEKETGTTFVDKTITNVIKMACENGYNQLNILNLITNIEPKSDKINSKQITNKNIEFIKQFINNNKSDILVAWGEKVKNNIDNKKIQDLIKFLKGKGNTLTFCPNKKDFPKHPGHLDFDCCTSCSGKGKIEFLPYYF